jgi:hypothetical protein
MSVGASAAFQAALEPWTTRLNEGAFSAGCLSVPVSRKEAREILRTSRKPAEKPAVRSKASPFRFTGLRDAAAVRRIKQSAGGLCRGEVFIPFHGLKAHASALAIHGAQWGRQSCLQPHFRRLANPEHWRSQRCFGVMSCRYRDVKPEKFVKGRASRLKAGCSQDWLPHKRAKAESWAEGPCGQPGLAAPQGSRE